ncbi:PhnB protein [Scopulibacillus darangshiensis]|uniref:PhnB protein n=1 Tax=Scopulibacillus darangshiensis TaxID=442528 RepID=A0A4V2SNF1_9BACL|nr:VOC family protein [Scopulibacillus darangshiensis]TCP30926.1 PhnB protein [Scopulibacillus darangshiensis]
MTIRMTPYLMMNGNAKEAIQFYEKALDAKIVSTQTYGEMESPEFPCPLAIRDRISFAEIKVDEAALMFTDTPGPPALKGNQVMICISTGDVEKSKRIFEALREGGRVNCPLEKTPFSPAFGNVTDKFGVTFEIVTESEPK